MCLHSCDDKKLMQMGQGQRGGRAQGPASNLHVLERAICEAVILARGGVSGRNNVGKEASGAFKCTSNSRTLLGRCGVAHADGFQLVEIVGVVLVRGGDDTDCNVYRQPCDYVQ